MTVQSAIEAELPFLRAEAEARMVDTWEIGEDGGWAYNPATGRDEQTILNPITTKGRVRVFSALGAREGEAGDRTVIETRRELHVPVSTPALPTGAVARCTAVGATSDPTLLGTVARLGGPVPGSQTTARRIEIIEVVS